MNKEKRDFDNIINAFAEKTNDKRFKIIRIHSKLHDNLLLIMNNIVLANNDYAESTYNLFEQFNNICESYIVENKINVKKLKICLESDNMEEEIEELLKETYKHITIEVKYEYLRTYRIYLILENKTVDFMFVYNAHLTFNANVDIIKEKIDTNILKYYKKGYEIK